MQLSVEAHRRRIRPGKAAAPQNVTSLAKARNVYFCSACGFESARWLGRCPQCNAWNSFDERAFPVAPRAAERRTAARSPE
ncbi:MAG: hypothetical protein WA814_12130, partial [Candidatus Baltobacteraceae bacterium]